MTSVDAEIKKVKEKELKAKKEQEDINIKDLLKEVNSPDKLILTIKGFSLKGSFKKKKKIKLIEDNNKDSDKDSKKDNNNDNDDKDNNIKEEKEDIYLNLINYNKIRKRRGLIKGKCIS
jgi:hypothetical protein